MKQPKQDIRTEDWICHEALSSEGRVDSGHEPMESLRCRKCEVVIGKNDIDGWRNTLFACKPFGSMEVEPIVAALSAEPSPSMPHAHMGWMYSNASTHAQSEHC